MESFDVIVVGGGPGGCTAASLVARHGHRVLLLEKAEFPRYQIGESLLPSTVHGICRILGVADEMAAAGFTPKRGGTFRWGSNPEPWTFTFATSPRMAGPTSLAYQVERMRFDEILLRHAARTGADVRERCAVTGLLAEGGRVRGVRYTDPGGRPREATARLVIDASGHTSRIRGGTGGRREYSRFFQNIALFGYFEGGKRLPQPNSGNILCAAFADGWFWYIPLTPELTSVGAVVRREMAARVQGDPETALNELIADCPLIADHLADARRVTSGPYGRLRTRKDYSYCDTAFHTPGLALVGDAACFIDPVFSSGVHLATYSALLAARSINSALAGTVPEAEAFAEFETRYRREFGLFYQFLLAFYEMNADERSYFWQAKKVTSRPVGELEAFVELVGGMASDEAALLGGRVRRTATDFDTAHGEAGALLASSMGADVMSEGIALQLRGTALGAPARREAPLRPGGLVPSRDGLHWERP